MNSRIIALVLVAAMALDGCASWQPRQPAPLSSQDHNVTVRVELARPVTPYYDSVYAGITRISIKVKNRGKRAVTVRSTDIAIELPDGQRFLPMSPREAEERVEAQRVQWLRTQAPEYGSEIFSEETQADDAGATTVGGTGKAIATRALKATCVPTWIGVYGGRVFPPLLVLGLVFGGPCAGGLAMAGELTHPPRQTGPGSRQIELDLQLNAVEDVFLGNDEHAEAMLHFPVARVVVRGASGAALTVPVVEFATDREFVVRLPITNSQP